MKRRTLIRNIGAAGIATTALSGSVAAASQTPVSDLDIDRELDVAAIDGEVTLEELLEPDELEALPADVNPSERIVTVSEEADSITIQDDCCGYCCAIAVVSCDCSCCVCDPAVCG